MLGAIRNPKLLYIKGGLMLLVGLMASDILVTLHSDRMTVVLLVTAVCVVFAGPSTLPSM